jgi:hypothetical protein
LIELSVIEKLGLKFAGEVFENFAAAAGVCGRLEVLII